jgi:hypothetical protein
VQVFDDSVNVHTHDNKVGVFVEFDTGSANVHGSMRNHLVQFVSNWSLNMAAILKTD